jgi:hypothetical protein
VGINGTVVVLLGRERMILKPSDLAAALVALLRAQRPTFIWSPPGIGKSRITAQVARAYAGVEEDDVDPTLYLRDVRLPTMDPVDVRGLPIIRDGGTFWTRPGFWPTDDDVDAGRALPKGVVFWDEASAAQPGVQVACYQMVLDRVSPSGDRLAKGWAQVAAGNRIADGAAAVRMSSALMNRFTHLELMPDLDDFIRWASKAGIHPMVQAFLRWKPALLHSHSANDRAYPTPRSWEFVSDIIHAGGVTGGIQHAIVAGTVGEGTGAEFTAFMRLYESLPDLDDVLKHPKTATIPGDKDPSMRYAVAYAVASRITKATIKNALIYLDRLPEEYAMLGVKSAHDRDRTIAETREFCEWATAHKHFLSYI